MTDAPRSDSPTQPADPPADSASASTGWNLAAAVAGWCLPGLGHFLLGQSHRAVLLAVTIGSLWLGGLLIGGLSIVDHTDHPAWFLGQMLIAPSLAADWYRGQLVAEQAAAYPDVPRSELFDPQHDPPFEPAYGRAHEQGTLFTSMAGLLNLLAIIDVLYREQRPVAAGVRP